MREKRKEGLEGTLVVVVVVVVVVVGGGGAVNVYLGG